jgi:lipoprotein signal peptidase
VTLEGILALLSRYFVQDQQAYNRGVAFGIFQGQGRRAKTLVGR